MENLPARVPYTLFPDLVSALVPSGVITDAELELAIIIDGENIPARDFAEYLALIDRMYGRLSPEGLIKYAHREWGRVQIAEIHKSQLEIIFRAIQAAHDIATWVVIAYALKTLSEMVKTNTDSYRNWADARKSLADARKSDEEARAIREDTRHKEIMNRNEESRLEESRFTRENRKHIRELIRQNPDLARLDDARINQLAALIDGLLAEGHPHLAAPIRFSRRKVKDVELRVKKRKADTQSDSDS
jgi:hypothetical protein